MGMGISWDDRIGEGFFERGNRGQLSSSFSEIDGDLVRK